MVKVIILAAALSSCFGSNENNIKNESAPANHYSIMDTTKSIHSFNVEGLDGNTISLSQYKGKKILIVNTASECGYTPQYRDLQKLYDKYQDKLIIIGFPCNNFGAQEPGTNPEIRGFCTKNYGVTFPMAAKIEVKGDNIAPIYHYLTHKESNGVLDAEISWNFNKFLIDENGIIIKKFESGVSPMSEEITSLLQ